MAIQNLDRTQITFVFQSEHPYANTLEEGMRPRHHTTSSRALSRPLIAACATLGMLSGTPSLAANIQGQVTAAGAPVADSTVTLWAAGTGAPRQLAQGQTSTDGRFTLNAD